MPEVHVYLAVGRSVDQKKKLMSAVTDAVVSALGSPIQSVTVQIFEAPATDKMVAGQTFAERSQTPTK